MKLTERIRSVVAYFQAKLPKPETELVYGSPFELLVAVILSAQCTDKRVNLVTPALFRRYPTPDALAGATPEEVFPLIQSISYPNNKAKALVGMARQLVDQHGGAVPDTLEALTALPGVGRKTANVILSVVFREPTAIAVDTHVFRVARRLGLVPTRAASPKEVEAQLVKLLPEFQRHVGDGLDVLGDLHHWLILHGRYQCHARKPACATCGLAHVCKYNLGSEELKATLDSINAAGPKTRRPKGQPASTGQPERYAHSTYEPEREEA